MNKGWKYKEKDSWCDKNCGGFFYLYCPTHTPNGKNYAKTDCHKNNLSNKNWLVHSVSWFIKLIILTNDTWVKSVDFTLCCCSLHSSSQTSWMLKVVQKCFQVRPNDIYSMTFMSRGLECLLSHWTNTLSHHGIYGKRFTSKNRLNKGKTEKLDS